MDLARSMRKFRAFPMSKINFIMDFGAFWMKIRRFSRYSENFRILYYLKFSVSRFLYRYLKTFRCLSAKKTLTNHHLVLCTMQCHNFIHHVFRNKQASKQERIFSISLGTRNDFVFAIKRSSVPLILSSQSKHAEQCFF